MCEKDIERERKRVCVCMCVFVCMCERKSVCVLVCANAYIINIDDGIMMTSRHVVPSAVMALCEMNPTAIRRSISQMQ